MRLANKIALITGGARGIGRATVELFAKEGAKVHACDLSFDADFATEGKHKIGVIKHKLDVTDFENWQEVVKSIVKLEGCIDILFNNAGTVLSYGRVGVWRGGCRLGISVCRPFRLAVP